MLLLINNREVQYMSKETSVTFFADDLGKKVYRKKVFYTLVVEQDVLANSEDEAEQKLSLIHI